MPKLTHARVEEIRQAMKAMPAPPPSDTALTKQEAVKMLAAEIASLQRRGYTLEQVAASLKGEGLDLTTPTLKSYLSRAKAGRRRRAPPRAAGSRPPAPPRAAGSRPPVLPESSRQEPASPPDKEAPMRAGKAAFLLADKDSY